MGKNAYQIANKINEDTELMSKFGKTTPAGIHYHIVRIREDLENTISEDALDTYIGEFIRARTGFEQDVSLIQDLVEVEMKASEEDRNVELILKLRRFIHEIKLDSFKMLQDSALPLQVKKLKYERNKMRPKQGVIENRTSKEGNSADTIERSE